jgi:hypothetical protein
MSGNKGVVYITTSGGESAVVNSSISDNRGNITINGSSGIVRLRASGVIGTITSSASLTKLALLVVNGGNITVSGGTITTAIVKLTQVGSVGFQSSATITTLELECQHTKEFDMRSSVSGGRISLLGSDGSQLNIENSTLEHVFLSGCELTGGILIQNNTVITDAFIIGCEIGGYIRAKGSGTTIARLVAIGNSIADASRLVRADDGAVISLASIVGNLSPGGTPYAWSNNVTKAVVEGNGNVRDFSPIAAGTDSYTATGYEKLINASTDGATALTISLPSITGDLVGRILAIAFSNDGGQNITVKAYDASGGENTIEESVDAGNTSITLDDAGDYILLQPVTTSKWMVVKNIGCTLY